MINVGAEIELVIPQLYYNNHNLRIDKSVVAITGTSIPKGASGIIETIEGDEIKLSLHWNPSNIPGNGHAIVIWVKRVIFGSSFRILQTQSQT